MARVDLSVATGGCGTGSFFGCWLPWLEWSGLGQSSLLNRLAKRVELEAQLLGDFSCGSSQLPITVVPGP